VILAGDIGGTKVNLALFERVGPGRVGPPIYPESHRIAAFGSFEELIESYRGRHPGTLDAISFGVAGVVARGHAKGTHIPWEIDAAAASRRLGGTPIHLLNDLVAAGYAVSAPAALDPELPPVHAIDDRVPAGLTEHRLGGGRDREREPREIHDQLTLNVEAELADLVVVVPDETQYPVCEFQKGVRAGICE